MKQNVELNDLIGMIQDNFETDDVSIRGGVLWIEISGDEYHGEEPTIIRVVPHASSHIGVHLTGGFDDQYDFEDRLRLAIDGAIHDNFSAIYIHDMSVEVELSVTEIRNLLNEYDYLDAKAMTTKDEERMREIKSMLTPADVLRAGRPVFKVG